MTPMQQKQVGEHLERLPRVEPIDDMPAAMTQFLNAMGWVFFAALVLTAVLILAAAVLSLVPVKP